MRGHASSFFDPGAGGLVSFDLQAWTERWNQNSRTWFPDVYAHGDHHTLRHMALGLTGEAGEVGNVVKKADRGTTALDRDALASELADVLIYTCLLASSAGIDLGAAAAAKTDENHRRWDAEPCHSAGLERCSGRVGVLGLPCSFVEGHEPPCETVSAPGPGVDEGKAQNRDEPNSGAGEDMGSPPPSSTSDAERVDHTAEYTEPPNEAFFAPQRYESDGDVTPDLAAEAADLSAASIAAEFHAVYERLAPQFGYETRKESAVPWSQVPQNNRDLMTAVAREVVGPIMEALVYAQQRIEKLESGGSATPDPEAEWLLREAYSLLSLAPKPPYTDQGAEWEAGRKRWFKRYELGPSDVSQGDGS